MIFVAITRQSLSKSSHQLGSVSRRVLPLSLFTTTTTTRRAHLHPLSTTVGATAAVRSSSNGLAIALGTVLVGLGSYYIGSTSASGPRSTKATSTNAAVALPPVYGSQEDFKLAINELEMSFEQGVVSTDPANLTTHGFSPNVMYEGEQCNSLIVTHFLNANPGG